MVLNSIISMVSAFMGKRCFIEEGKDYFQRLYPNVWMLTIAKSGQFKSTALNKGAKIALRRNYEITKEIKALKKDLEFTVETDQKNEIKEKIKNLYLKSPILPTKVTAEGLLEFLSEGRGGLILSNELSGWLQNLEKKFNNDLKAIFTEFYDIPLAFEYKTRTQGDLIIEKPFISICGVSPFTGIKTNININDVSSGFLPRFLIFMPPHKKEIPPALPNRDVFVNPEVEKKFEDVLFSLIDKDDDQVQYVLTDEAKILYENIHTNIYKMVNAYDEKCQEILEPFVRRWSPYILKLSMIMQFLENPNTNEIQALAIKSAWAVALIAIKSTAFLYQGELGESENQRKCRILLEFIQRKYAEKNAPILRQLIMSSKKLEGGSKEYDDVLDMLIQQGRIEVDMNKKKKNEWTYIPIFQKS